MLVLLGISFAFSAQGIHCCPSEDKIYKWTAVIRRALAFGALEPGAASKLAGALSWASQSLFKRLGRAFFAPIIRPAARELPSDQRAVAHRPDMVAGGSRIWCARSSGMGSAAHGCGTPVCGRAEHAAASCSGIIRTRQCLVYRLGARCRYHALVLPAQ